MTILKKKMYTCQACGDTNFAKRRVSPKLYILGVPYILLGFALLVFPVLLFPWALIGYLYFFRRECEKCKSKSIKLIDVRSQDNQADKVVSDQIPASDVTHASDRKEENLVYAAENISGNIEKDTAASIEIGQSELVVKTESRKNDQVSESKEVKVRVKIEL